MTGVVRLPRPKLQQWQWPLFGACRNEDTERFYHPDGERGTTRSKREAYAKAICASCPVLVSCRTHALSTREPYGVWGGLSECDREQILNTAPTAA